MASITEVLKREEEQQHDFQTIFGIDHRSDGTGEEMTRLLLSFLDNSEDPKTIAALQCVNKMHRKCLEDTLACAKKIYWPAVEEKRRKRKIVEEMEKWRKQLRDKEMYERNNVNPQYAFCSQFGF